MILIRSMRSKVRDSCRWRTLSGFNSPLVFRDNKSSNCSPLYTMCLRRILACASKYTLQVDFMKLLLSSTRDIPHPAVSQLDYKSSRASGLFITQAIPQILLVHFTHRTSSFSHLTFASIYNINCSSKTSTLLYLPVQHVPRLPTHPVPCRCSPQSQAPRSVIFLSRLLASY